MPRFVAELVYPGNQRDLRVGPLPAGIYPQLGEFYSNTTRTQKQLIVENDTTLKNGKNWPFCKRHIKVKNGPLWHRE